MRNKVIKWTNWRRLQELQPLTDYLEPLAKRSARLLEIGGGNGFQAKHLADMGFDVVSIDPEPRQPSHFHIQLGDCTNLQFEDKSFDIIFSSNVLEHITDLPAAFAEMKRVLKPDGIMIHTMPTQINTALTFLTQPIGYFLGLGFVIKEAAKLAASVLSASKPKQSSTDKPISSSKLAQHKSLNKQNLIETIKIINPLRLIIPPPHGVSSSCFTELYYWKPKIWCDRLEQNGLRVKKVVNLPLAYSRHSVMPFRFIKVRRFLAKAGITSCVAYILQC